MADLTREELAELREKLAAATAHPWCAEFYRVGGRTVAEFIYRATGMRSQVARFMSPTKPDAEMVVALVNAAPQLIAMTERLLEIEETGMANLLGDRIRHLERQLAEMAERTAGAVALLNGILPPLGCLEWKVGQKTMDQWRAELSALERQSSREARETADEMEILRDQLRRAEAERDGAKDAADKLSNQLDSALEYAKHFGALRAILNVPDAKDWRGVFEAIGDLRAKLDALADVTERLIHARGEAEQQDAAIAAHAAIAAARSDR